MKTKKMFLLFIAIFLTYLPCSLFSVTAIKTFQTPDQALQAIAEMEQTIATETPMQANIRSIKSMFETKTLSTLALRGRPDLVPSKTSQFNKTFLKYIKEIYNESDYAEVLSQNGTHIIDFLELSSEVNLDVATTYVCIRLFYNKIKACELIDDTMLNQVIPHFPKHLDRFFYSKDEGSNKLNLSFLKKNIESMLINKITAPLPEFQRTNDFTQALGNEIITLIQKEAERAEREQYKYESRERLRQIVIRFLELTLSKLVWNPKAPEGIWQSFLALANNLQLLGAYGIINHMDDLDDLLWSLTHRFCYFLDLSGSVLPLELYEEIENDLKNKLVFFLETQEQDAGIKTKKETLAESILQAKTKAYAYYKKGLIMQPF